MRRSSYEETRAFAELAAGRLVRELAGLATTEWLKRKREGVYVDARQNGWGKTIASVYSVRPRDGAPVSTPLRWEELTEALDPGSLGMAEASARLEREGDLFEPVLRGRRALGPAMRRLQRL